MSSLDDILDRHAVPGSVCLGCCREVDPDLCWCGEEFKAHTMLMDPNHSPVPMGCVCHYDKQEPEEPEEVVLYDQNWEQL